MTTTKDFVQENAERLSLEQLSDGKLLRKGAREMLIAVCVIANAMMRQAAVLATKPAEVGVLMRALAECFRAATVAFKQARNIDSR